MKTNKFLGLVGTAAAMFAVFSIACAAPAVQRSGDDSNDESSSKDDTSSTPTTTTAPTQPVTSTATTTGTTTTTTDAGTVTVPAVDWCGKLSTCAENSDDIFQLAGYLGTAAVGNQTACQVGYVACKANIFQSNCDKLTDCCDEMASNGNAALSNACRTKANAGNSSACSTQLDSYQADGRCN